MAELPELGIWVWGEFFERESPEEGHEEIALRIINSRMSWKYAYEHVTEMLYRNPVDFLIYKKGAVKIGNRFGAQVVTYCVRHLDKEAEGVVSRYKVLKWRVEEMY